MDIGYITENFVGKGMKDMRLWKGLQEYIIGCSKCESSGGHAVYQILLLILHHIFIKISAFLWVYLILSSWVSNGIVGSPAFAAYDQGFDVFLGNFRGLVSREHVDKKITSRQYWRYSINEHGTEDLPAMIEKIHEVKTSELKICQPDVEEETKEDQPYKLCAICHSLGGAAMLMYVITSRIEEKPHRLSRLVLLSPAGFHYDSPQYLQL
ncbi:lysosomal acid lipase/cholesteryl ester hydrolase-like [Carica papaya]|uniref:lysosomal acid lipase/cholesteryl ester hydrolase-like n=1 Tax=Carica papaya TaxID=3649 RepID=UPI000B8CFB90|nr:lysosomal acid lipase/cholesteryl ester hydrolase-like [Carica papaya]